LNPHIPGRSVDHFHAAFDHFRAEQDEARWSTELQQLLAS